MTINLEQRKLGGVVVLVVLIFLSVSSGICYEVSAPPAVPGPVASLNHHHKLVQLNVAVFSKEKELTRSANHRTAAGLCNDEYLIAEQCKSECGKLSASLQVDDRVARAKEFVTRLRRKVVLPSRDEWECSQYCRDQALNQLSHWLSWQDWTHVAPKKMYLMHAAIAIVKNGGGEGAYDDHDEARSGRLPLLPTSLPGHILETGTHENGNSAFLRIALDANGLHGRDVYSCDRFMDQPQVAQGSPPEENGSSRQKVLKLGLKEASLRFQKLGYSTDVVYSDEWTQKQNMERENWIVHAATAAERLITEDEDDEDAARVHLVKGSLKETMPHVRDQLIRTNRTLSILRLNGETYASVADVLYNLYDLVDVGGIIIIDEWNWENLEFEAAGAVLDFLVEHDLLEDHSPAASTGRRGAMLVKKREVKVRWLEGYWDARRRRKRKPLRHTIDWGEAEWHVVRLAGFQKQNDLVADMVVSYGHYSTPCPELVTALPEADRVLQRSKALSEAQSYLPQGFRRAVVVGSPIYRKLKFWFRMPRHLRTTEMVLAILLFTPSLIAGEEKIRQNIITGDCYTWPTSSSSSLIGGKHKNEAQVTTVCGLNTLARWDATLAQIAEKSRRLAALSPCPSECPSEFTVKAYLAGNRDLVGIPGLTTRAELCGHFISAGCQERRLYRTPPRFDADRFYAKNTDLFVHKSIKDEEHSTTALSPYQERAELEWLSSGGVRPY